MAKLFISHASEDKACFVEPLVDELKNRGFEVWYDKYELTVGDSLLKKIGQGLNEADFGVVVLSRDFFKKKWPQAELDGLFALETTEKKVILPVWKDVTEEEVRAFSPPLAGKLGTLASKGVGEVAADLQRAVQASETTASFSIIENVFSRLQVLDREVGGTRSSKNLSASTEGVKLVADAANELMIGLRDNVQKMAETVKNLEIKLDSETRHQVAFAGSFRLRFVVRYDNDVQNTIDHAQLRLLIYQNLDRFGEDSSKRKDLRREDYNPLFHHSGKLLWRSTNTNKEYTTEQLSIRLMEEIIEAFRSLHDAHSRR
jgi:hypothetical protein